MALLLIVMAVCPLTASAQSLKGSSAAVAKAYKVAQERNLTFVKTASQVKGLVASGQLQEVTRDGEYELHRVSFPYAIPEILTFLRRLAPVYRSACGETLVVTSLTRPIDRQPPNASPRSVHPAGMAVDLRRSKVALCRSFLESYLLDLEGKGVLEATRERYPPHYHIALFPKRYASYVRDLESGEPPEEVEEPPEDAEKLPSKVTAYVVTTGDSLWSIAHRFETTVEKLKRLNKLTGARIDIGQSLVVPQTTSEKATTPPEPSVKAAP